MGIPGICFMLFHVVSYVVLLYSFVVFTAACVAMCVNVVLSCCVFGLLICLIYVVIQVYVSSKFLP